ncbi:DUF2894 domain-containing protein [Inhella proteolytica]|uniref:DUF2894 domain-containing protein n=1 Tax=Inhella proteolytica TaxID=2795029 RepID=A0A931J5I3_9BURK|nr:DUF2894 domain-containing protein [Inhella proteolytica]MBH9577242.1 DUF2894 domain-containing protein [Inhella proteolytica]
MDAQALHQDPEAALQAHPLRAHTAPARWAVLQGLARRAAQQQGALRAALLHKLAQRLQALPVAADGAAAATADAQPAASSPLQALAALVPSRPDELQALQFDRRDWTRLRLSQRLSEPSAAPETPASQLGPLHTQVLVPQALAQLRELSPEYLQRLLTQLDQLLALAPASPASAGAPRRGRRKS